MGCLGCVFGVSRNQRARVLLLSILAAFVGLTLPAGADAQALPRTLVVIEGASQPDGERQLRRRVDNVLARQGSLAPPESSVDTYERMVTSSESREESSFVELGIKKVLRLGSIQRIVGIEIKAAKQSSDDRIVRMIVVDESGRLSKDWTVPADEVPELVVAAIGSLEPLPIVGRAGTAPLWPIERRIGPSGGPVRDEATATAEYSGETNVGRQGRGVELNYRKKLESDSVRQAWKKRGGQVTAYNAALNGVYFGVKNDFIDISAFGFGGKFGLTSLWLDLPQPGGIVHNWNSFRLGIESSLQTLFTESSSSFGSSSDSTYLFTGTMQLGWQWGLGRFLSRSKWAGLVLSLDYRPSVSFNLENPEPTFSYLGLGFGIEPTDLNAAIDDIAKEAHFRFDLLFLPPIGDLPLLVSAGLGWTWY